MTSWLEAMGMEQTCEHRTLHLTTLQLRLLAAIASGPKCMRDLHAATGRRLSASRLRTALEALSSARLVEQNRALPGPNGGRPRENWRLLPNASATAKEALRTRPLPYPSSRRHPIAANERQLHRIRRRRARRPVPVGMAERILNWISEGRYLLDFCGQPGTPAPRTVYDWMRKDPAFRHSFEEARELGEMQIEEELLMLVDSPTLQATGLIGALGYRAFQRRVIGPYFQRLHRWRHHATRRVSVTVVSGL